MDKYAQDKLRLWQANTLDDWKAELVRQGYTADCAEYAASLATKYNKDGYNIREAREKAIDALAWHSSGEF